MKCLALGAIVVGLGAGCSGINTTQGVSPLMFFLPGLVQSTPVSRQIIPVKSAPATARMAANGDLSPVN